MPPRRSRTNVKKKEAESSSKMEVDEEGGEEEIKKEMEIKNKSVNGEKRNAEKSEEDKEDNDDEDDEEEDDDDESEDDAPPAPLMVHERARRSKAGNKMAALLSSAEQEDEFYKTAYGGFDENDEVDKEFESPVHSDDDEVDSDFDKPEEEDEPISDNEEDEEKRRKRKKFKEPKRGMTADDVLAKNKKWAMARLAGNLVAANSVDEKTQAKLLEEARETERINIESLKKYEEFELEKKRKRERASVRVLAGPREQIRMTKEGTMVTVGEIKKFESQKPRIRNVCAVTGRPARYFDPITRLPYSTPYAFKVIRDKYNKFLRTVDGNQEVDEYFRKLKQIPTPPESPAPISLNPTSIVAESSISA